MKSVLISIQPKWCELIAKGEKTVEVRKTKPKLEIPFKVYIYCTKGNLALLRDDGDAEEKYKYDVWYFAEFHQSCGKKILLGGKVIGEFVCDEVYPIKVHSNCAIQNWMWYELSKSCLTLDEVAKYIGANKMGYGWHISDLVIYDKPKELDEFHKVGYNAIQVIDFVKTDENYWRIQRPPQSWCYVEEV